MALRAPERRGSRATARPELRVVHTRARRKRRAARLPAIIVAVVVATVFGFTALQVSRGDGGLRSSQLERDLQQETERLALLRAKVAQLSTPGRIAEEAGKLGLVPADQATYLQVAVDPKATDQLVPASATQPALPSPDAQVLMAPSSDPDAPRSSQPAG